MPRFASVFSAVIIASAVGCGASQQARDSNPGAGKFKMGMMPKIASIAYFKACEQGAREAAQELGIDFVYDGPDRDDVRDQIRMLEQWITEGYDCIAVAPNDPASISGVLEKAQRKGITVLTFDADADSGRQYFVNQVSYDDIAHTLLDTLVEEMGPEGKVGILTSTLQAPNQSQWAKRMRQYREARYPKIQLLDEYESQENSKLGIDRAKDMIQAHPDLKGIIGLTSIAFPAAAEAVEQQGKKGQVHVVGLSLPREMRKYVHNGTVKTVILWKPVDLGYLTVHVADLVRKGHMKGEGKIRAGRLGDIEARDGYEVLLGPPMKFTAENIDQYDF
ncbi:MAG TPA: substrate-binding domain-containing protein [Gemmataceae bacterium]|jgi:rhamnose transport system substrate-binding protein|nr:substrate-binding domain-containing protein [Gemmataceae bacterium]